MINSYELKEKIGEGAMGKIYLAINKNDNKLYAIKVIDKTIAELRDIKKSIEKERKFLNELRHTNIILLHEVITTLNHCYIVLDYCNGDSLLKCLKKYKKKYKKPFKEEIVPYLMRQIDFYMSHTFFFHL